MPSPAIGSVEDTRALEEACARAVLERSIGTVLQAPQRVAAGNSAALILSGYRVASLRAAAEWPPLDAMALLIASHLESGRVFVATARAPDTMAIGKPPAAPDPGEGCTGSTFRYDLAARLGFSPAPGRLCVWMIVRGEASGPVRIELFDPESRPIDDPEVLKFLAGWHRKNPPKPRGANPRNVWPAEAVFGAYPSYRTRTDGPPVPTTGISLSTPDRAESGSSAPWVLSGAFRVAIQRRQLVLKTVSGYATTAVVPITLIITTNHEAGPLLLPLRLPSESPVSSSADMPVVEGRFSLNLFAMRGMWREPGTYFIYAICGDTLSAPAVTTLVARHALARAG
jgi:hypothetical protein